MKKLFFLLLICVVSAPLAAKGITNQALLKACKDKSAVTQNFCYGYIISVANAAQFYRNIVDVKDEYIDICFPENVTNKEIVELYIAWVEKIPSVLNSPAFIGVSSSFSQKYSCSTQKKDKKENQQENPKSSIQRL